MGPLLGEGCFGLQWHTLIKHKENVKKGLGSVPEQTAVLRCRSDGGRMDNACHRAWLGHKGWSGAQRDPAAFRPLNRGTGMGRQGPGERGLLGCAALEIGGTAVSGAAGHKK